MSAREPGPVVHVVVAGEVGGAERMLVDLLRDRDRTSDGDKPKRSHSVALFTPNPRLRHLFIDAGLAIDDRGLIGGEGSWRYLVRAFGRRDVAWLTHVFRSRGAAIAHLHTFGSHVLGTRAALQAGVRIVRTEHSTRVYDDPSCWPFSRWSLAHANAVVCVSKHVMRVALRKAPWLASKARVITNGIDTAHFAPSAVIGPTIASNAEAKLRFVALGRLDPRKGLDVALEALARVPNATLDIAGDGSERARLVALTGKLGLEPRVRFLGFLDDVRPVLSSVDMALTSARTEGLGIALLEAMAMGRAVLGLATGGIPEIVTDGVTGWLVEGRDGERERTIAELARAMQNAVDHPNEVRARGIRARAHVCAKFSVETMRRGYEEVYASL